MLLLDGLINISCCQILLLLLLLFPCSVLLCFCDFFCVLFSVLTAAAAAKKKKKKKLLKRQAKPKPGAVLVFAMASNSEASSISNQIDMAATLGTGPPPSMLLKDFCQFNPPSDGLAVPFPVPIAVPVPVSVPYHYFWPPMPQVNNNSDFAVNQMIQEAPRTPVPIENTARAMQKDVATRSRTGDGLNEDNLRILPYTKHQSHQMTQLSLLSSQSCFEGTSTLKNVESGDASLTNEKKKKSTSPTLPEKLTLGANVCHRQNPTCIPKKQRVVPPKERVENPESIRAIEDYIIYGKNIVDKPSDSSPESVLMQPISLEKSFFLSNAGKQIRSGKQLQHAHSPLSTLTSPVPTESPALVQHSAPQRVGNGEPKSVKGPVTQNSTPKELEWGKYLALSCASANPSSIHEEIEKPEIQLPFQKRFAKLQDYLKQLDQPNSKYLTDLKYSTPAIRNKLAVELEKRVIKLSLDEVAELGQMKELDVLGKGLSHSREKH